MFIKNAAIFNFTQSKFRRRRRRRCFYKTNNCFTSFENLKRRVPRHLLPLPARPPFFFFNRKVRNHREEVLRESLKVNN